MTHLEIEYKTLLTKAEFLQLKKEFASIPAVQQTNYYIDTPDFALKANRFSLRIRTLEQTAELTLKVPQTVGNLEYNQDLTIQEAQNLIQHFQLPTGPIFDLLQDYPIPLEKLAIWGHLSTTRREHQHAIGLMALDANVYLDKQDYELEVEVSNAEEGKVAFDQFLKEHRIQFKYASSKVARCAALAKSKN